MRATASCPDLVPFLSAHLNGDTIPKCPHCGKEITELHNVQSGTAVYVLNKNGDYREYTNFFEVDGRQNYYNCPECDRTIATDEEKALQFLNGETL